MINRRQFFNQLTQFVGLIFSSSLISKAFSTNSAHASGPSADSSSSASWELVTPGSPGMATNLKYYHTIGDFEKNVKDDKLKVERNGVPFKKQNCANCAQYQTAKKSIKNGEEVAPCNMFMNPPPAKAVKSTGFCIVWSRSPGYKG